MKLMLIGGGEIGKGTTSYETEKIDKEIVRMTNKDNPNFLFIGLASFYSDSYYDIIKRIYKDLGCTTSYLKKKNIINNPDIVKDKLMNADIIYIGGGDTIKLLDDIKEYHLDKLLIKEINNNKVVAGISAGAILLSKSGYSDALILRKESENYSFIKGLNIVDINISPHYNDELKKKELFEDLKNTNIEIYGLENNTALKINDNEISIIKSNSKAKAYLVSYENKIIEKELN